MTKIKMNSILEYVNKGCKEPLHKYLESKFGTGNYVFPLSEVREKFGYQGLLKILYNCKCISDLGGNHNNFINSRILKREVKVSKLFWKPKKIEYFLSVGFHERLIGDINSLIVTA